MAATARAQAVQAQLQVQRLELGSLYQQALADTRKFSASLAYYEQTGLPQAAVIVRLSTRAFKAGEMGYSEYLLNLDRALKLRTAYLDTLLAHNQTSIELDYLLGDGAQ